MSKGIAAICLWGGFGSRQRLITRRESSQPSKIGNPSLINTNAVPKPMMPIATVPMCKIMVDKLAEAGLDKVFATTHFMDDVIRNYYLAGKGRGSGVQGLWFENVAMGTAPGLAMNLLLRKSLRESTIVIPSGDIISDMDIREAIKYHTDSGSLCTIALNPVPEWEVHRFGTAELKITDGPLGNITAFKEKKSPREALQSMINGQNVFLNNSSFYIIEPALFLMEMTMYNERGEPTGKTTLLEKMFPQIDRQFLRKLISGEIDVESAEQAAQLTHYLGQFNTHDNSFNDFGGHIFPILAKNGFMRGYYFDRYWNDVGNNETYWFANWHALAGRFKMNIPFKMVRPGIWKADSATVMDMEHIKPPAIIGERVFIDTGATVGPFAIIDEGWVVENGAKISYSITWPQFGKDSSYPSDRSYRVIRKGAVVEKSFIGGILPVADHLFKVVVGDGEAEYDEIVTREDGSTNPTRIKLRVRTIVGLKTPEGSVAAIAKQTKRVLIVDDDITFSDPLVDTLSRAGWEMIETATTIAEAERKLAAEHYDLILLDSVLDPAAQQGVADGVRLLKEYKLSNDQPNNKTPVLFWSSYESENALVGLGSADAFRLSELGTRVMRKEDEDVKPGKISDFLLREILKIK